MKMAKKQLALCLAALTLLLVFTGCHGSRGLEAFEIPESFDADRPLEITFWAKNDTNKTQTDIYARAIEEFEALYPNIHVNIRLYTDYSRIYESRGDYPTGPRILNPGSISLPRGGSSRGYMIMDMEDDGRYDVRYVSAT